MRPPATSPHGHRIALALLAMLSGPSVGFPAVAETHYSDSRDAYVLFSEGSRSTTMSGSTDDLDRARRLRNGQEALLYVSQGGAAYIIRDAATLRRAKSIFEPQRALGAQQAALGSRQAELGSRQAALGRSQATLGFQQARLSRQAGDSSGGVEALGRAQDTLGRQQDVLGRQQDALGRQQDALGREQDRLGREAETQLRALIADAFQRGIAERVDRR
jgi:hypothetical protein